METYYWPKTTNFTLKGNYFDPYYSRIEYQVLKWNGTNSKGNLWKSDEIIKAKTSEINLDVILSNSYFDGNDYENPIKDYLDDRIYAFPNWGYWSKMVAYTQKNSIELKDSVYRYSPDGDDKEFSCMIIGKNKNIQL